MIHALCLAIACCLPQDEPEEVTIEQELEALITKTNALESLHLIYDLESTSDDETGKGSLEFVYRAPNLGHMRVSADGRATDFWVVDGNVYLQSDDEWKSAHVSDPPMAPLMRELFPGAEKPLEPGVSFLLSATRGASEEPSFNLNFSWSWSGRDHVLGWLHDLRSRTGVARQDESFVWEDEGIRCRISRRTGLLEEIGADSSARWHLRSADTDVELPPELVTLPDEALEAPLDAEFARTFTYPPPLLRRQAFLRVEGLLSSGARDFDARARKDWRSVMDAMHRETMLQSYTEWIAQLQTLTTRNAEWLRRQLVANPSPERRAELEKWVAETRAKNEKVIETTRERYASLPKVESEGLEPRAELYEVEEEAVAALWEELVSGAVLTHFDEEMARALEN